jgi:hypothetical protein
MIYKKLKKKLSKIYCALQFLTTFYSIFFSVLSKMEPRRDVISIGGCLELDSASEVKYLLVEPGKCEVEYIVVNQQESRKI